jgi:UDP-N-acetylmuramate dehydrogenase
MPSLQQYHTFSLASNCASIVEFDSVDSFLNAYNPDLNSYILGGGSNSVFLNDFDGVVLVNKIKGISHYDTESHHHISVGAGEDWHEFVSLCMQNEWFGLENLALIPGSVGASPIQNIGAYGVEIHAFIDSIEAILLETKEPFLIKGADCQFGYRDSIFKHALYGKALITKVNFTLPKDYDIVATYGELAVMDSPTALDIFNKVIEVRKAKLPDPKQLGNAGSFFKNPVIALTHFEELKRVHSDIPSYPVSENEVKVPAAWLIDKTGFKGKALNEVRCHPTQPLVLTNIGNAQSDDLIALAKQIMHAVESEFKILLEPEVRLVGEKGLISL